MHLLLLFGGVIIAGAILGMQHKINVQGQALAALTQASKERQVKIFQMIDSLDKAFEAIPKKDRKHQRRTHMQIAAHTLKWSVGMIPDDEFAFYKKDAGK